MVLLEVSQLSKKFEPRLNSQESSFTALHQINLSIEKGDIYGIIGQSGAGKSTLIRSLAMLCHPTSGKIIYEGKDLLSLKGERLRALRTEFGMIFQSFNLFSSRDVAGNIAYPMEIAGKSQQEIKSKVSELLKLVGLESKKASYPSELSGGQKQRVAVARALANKPKVLLCDEATSALDPKTTSEIVQLLKNLQRSLGLTLIIVTHEMEIIRQICNKVAVMEKGQVIESGLVSELFSFPKTFLTQSLLQNAHHELPQEFFEGASERKKLLRLTFKGNQAKEPVISMMVRRFNVDANILQGWIDRLAEPFIVGTLILELLGDPSSLEQSLDYLQSQAVHYEVLKRE